MLINDWLAALGNSRFGRRRSRRNYSDMRRAERLSAALVSVQRLEDRTLLASDFGDAPQPYPTTAAEGGAEHIVNTGDPRLGATVDTEADGAHRRPPREIPAMTG